MRFAGVAMRYQYELFYTNAPRNQSEREIRHHEKPTAGEKATR
jgi:hypothetical protein